MPEGLPAIISIILFGRADHGAAEGDYPQLPTVETSGDDGDPLDKTGTLTHERDDGKAVTWRIPSIGWKAIAMNRFGNIPPGRWRWAGVVAPGTLLERYLRTIDLCNDSQLIKDESGLWKITGGPTEGALKVLAAKVALPTVATELRSKIPFDSQYKYMSTLYRIGNEEMILITGAPDVVPALSAAADGGWPAAAESALLGSENRRVRAGRVAERSRRRGNRRTSGQSELTHQDLQQVILLGIAGMMDPPRPEAITAIGDRLQAGIG